MIGTPDVQAVLTRELSVRVINVSAGGCLVESHQRIEVGTIGTLQLKLGSEECKDDVEVVRCELVEGDRSVYHVGVRLLRTRPRQAGTIRHAVARHMTDRDRWMTGRVM
jgi:hypothetical protein